jgi:hypothetical protein
MTTSLKKDALRVRKMLERHDRECPLFQWGVIPFARGDFPMEERGHPGAPTNGFSLAIIGP